MSGMTLIEFLLARIAEDEAAARAAMAEAQADYFFGDTAAAALLGLAKSEGAEEAAIAHFARHVPARVLAECEAKRWIVEVAPSLEGVLGALASVYADHPDYDQAWWRP